MFLLEQLEPLRAHNGVSDGPIPLLQCREARRDELRRRIDETGLIEIPFPLMSVFSLTY